MAVSGTQPLSTIYGGAHLFKADTVEKLGRLARATFEQFMPDPAALSALFGICEDAVWQRVKDKLNSQPVEDFRIDFEDGYGYRGDEQEDKDAAGAAVAMLAAMQAGTLPPFFGIRIKSLTESSAARSLRTLRVFIDSLSGSQLPENFVVTVPKVSSPMHVSNLLQALDELGLGSVDIELMVEEPMLFGSVDAESALPSVVATARDRCRGLHLGAYDLMSALGIVASVQTLDHPACDFARQQMLFGFAQSSQWLSDGATTVLPVPPHKGAQLSAQQQSENAAAIQHGLQVHYRNVRRALLQGFYQGWDLHPAQLPARYAAVFSFFLESLPSMQARLSAFESSQAQASLAGAAFDDAATGRGLRAFFARARACGIG